MTPLRQRMLNDMTVRGLAENTKKSYLSSVTGLARHYRRSPDQVSAQEVQDYLIHLHEHRGLAWQSCNCVRHGIRFFYRITLGLPEPHFYLPGAKTPSTLDAVGCGTSRSSSQVPTPWCRRQRRDRHDNVSGTDQRPSPFDAHGAAAEAVPDSDKRRRNGLGTLGQSQAGARFHGSSWQPQTIGRKELTPSVPIEPLLSP